MCVQSRFSFLILSLLLMALTAMAPCRSGYAAYVSEELTAIRMASQGTYYAAGTRSKNETIRTLMGWFYLTEDKSRPAVGDMMSFVQRNGNWPLMSAIRIKIEQALEDKNPLSQAAVCKWFEAYPPLTDDGKFVYVMALPRSKAVLKLREYWEDGAFNSKQQEKLLSVYKNFLASDNHEARLDNLIWQGNYDRAEIALDYVGQSHYLLGKARLLLAQRKAGVERAIANVPTELNSHKGLIYERIRWRRRSDFDKGALDLLNSVGVDNLPYPDKWWLERNILARRAIERKDYHLAYTLATQHGHDEGVALAEGEWFAGWMALNYLNQPATAFKHFRELFDKTSTPISRSRGSYWAGVAAERTGKKDVAKQWYQVAAQYYETYYGQMAGSKLAAGDGILRAFVQKKFEHSLTSPQTSAFEQNELVKAVDILSQAGVDNKITRLFMIKLRNTLPEETGYSVLYARLAKKIEDYEALHLMGKRGLNNHRWNFIEAAFPVLPVRLTKDTPQELAYAIMRQESAFNQHAISSAGARGLMQLMPATAKMVARQKRMQYSLSNLTENPNYNVTLGQAYLGGLVQDFDGALPMAIAGYNAGPNRVKQWIEIFGDPRKQEISWVDWIESIPISETRNYVQRVLENMQIYKYHLS